MTGGGAGTFAIQREPTGNYMGAPSGSNYYQVGSDVRAESMDLQNALVRINNFGAEPIDARETSLEGALSLSGIVTEDTAWALNHCMGQPPTQSGSGPYDYTWDISAGRCQSARAYVGVDYLSGTAEREAKGLIIPQIDFDITRGEPVRFNATALYGDEEKNTSLTPGSQPSPTGPELMFHGGDLQIPNSTSLTKMESASFSLSPGARFQRDWQRVPADAVMGASTHTLTPEKVITDTDLLELAYGASGSPTTDVSGAADGKLVFGSGGTTTVTFDFTGLTPNTYSWANFGDNEADKLENTELFVDSTTATLTTDTSSAR